MPYSPRRRDAPDPRREPKPIGDNHRATIRPAGIWGGGRHRPAVGDWAGDKQLKLTYAPYTELCAPDLYSLNRA
jgi:hypothetical protein